MTPLLVLTDRQQAALPLVDVVAAAVEGGARWICLREKDLTLDDRLALALEIEALMPSDGVLSIASTRRSGWGTHLASDDPLGDVAGGPLGRSCHDGAEIAAAAAEGCDYATLSPVFLTDSKPGYGPALGIDELARRCCETNLPIFALGGITVDNARVCVHAGATGVAVMGEIMRAADPADLTRRFMEEIQP